jgi:hypothetical protein
MAGHHVSTCLRAFSTIAPLLFDLHVPRLRKQLSIKQQLLHVRAPSWYWSRAALRGGSWAERRFEPKLKDMNENR